MASAPRSAATDGPPRAAFTTRTPGCNQVTGRRAARRYPMAATSASVDTRASPYNMRVLGRTKSGFSMPA